MLESGYKISDLNTIPFTGIEGSQKNKIALDETYMLGYANSVYGIKYNRNNYKIPLSAIREDVKGYIGIESMVAPWSEQMKLWHGVWYDNASKNRSYVYEWDESEKNHPHYMPNKFLDLENSYYIIRNAPFPYESEDKNNRNKGELTPLLNAEGENYISTNKILSPADPYPDSNKLVLKSYVDERLASKRLIDVKTEFWVRDYDCSYVIRAKELKEATKKLALNDKLIIKVHYPLDFENRVKNNNLSFSLLVEGVETESGSGIFKPAISNPVIWEFYDSNDNKLNICWLNKTDENEIIIPNLHEERLYDNARYIIFNFQTVTDTVENIDKYEIIDGENVKVKEYTKAIYSVYASCENMLYRNRALTTVNGNIIEHLHITSSNNSLIVNNTFNSGSLTLDLTVNQKLPKYEVVSPDDSVIVNTVINGEDTIYEVSVIKPEEIEILSSETVKVNEIHSKNTKYYSFDIAELDIIPNDASIRVEKYGNSWEIGTNLVLEPGDNINVEEIDTKDAKGWRISATGITEPTQNKNKIILKELSEELVFANARNEVYKASGTPSIRFNFSSLEEQETVSTKIYFNTKENTADVNINSDIEWVMTNNGSSPQFKSKRLYCISLTALPDFISGNGYKVLGRVEWFQHL